ncbi:MAG: class A beta-lactamase-related serine hydrolase [Actinobacteria bacterium]|nr:class A beta-lactamase-related serine hydrolase [Actinomycetota bacterium]
MRGRRGAAGALPALCAALLAGCGAGSGSGSGDPAGSADTGGTSGADGPPSASAGTASAGAASALTATPTLPGADAAFLALPDGLGRRAGVAITPVRPPEPLGSPRWSFSWGGQAGGPAWSTIKVPLAVAFGSAFGAGEADTQRRTLEQSDNDAAGVLWTRLGSGATAASAVQAELRAGGDAQTVVPYAEVRAPYTPYGQTDWTLARSATYAASLPCRPAAAAAYQHLRTLAASPGWGLGAVGAEAYKGGWGPRVEGGYLARQLGVLTTADGGRVAVAVLVVSDGGYDVATAELTTVAQFVGPRVRELPGGRC